MVTPSSRGGPWGARNHVAKAGLGKGHVGGHSRVGGKTVLNNRHRKIARDTILGITRPDIKRLARRGGVKRISMGIYGEIRTALKDRLETILRTCVIFVEHRNAKTITTTDVIYSLRRIGRPIYGFDPDTYDGKKKPQHAGTAD